MNHVDYSTVTELPGSKASKEQLQRIANRYYFAAEHCRDRDVLEVACGSGIGLGLLNERSRSLIAGDIDEELLAIARQTYGGAIDCRRVDARHLPFEDDKFDVIVFFEAIYYLEDPTAFVKEARRVLRDRGTVIVCNPNRDLPDFNPSPHSYNYFNALGFSKLFGPEGFEVEIFGDGPVDKTSASAKILRFAKKTAVSLNLIPSTMKGKELLKRFVFGSLVTLPEDLAGAGLTAITLSRLSCDIDDKTHKVIFCIATLGAS